MYSGNQKSCLSDLMLVLLPYEYISLCKDDNKYVWTHREILGTGLLSVTVQLHRECKVFLFLSKGKLGVIWSLGTMKHFYI